MNNTVLFLIIPMVLCANDQYSNQNHAPTDPSIRLAGVSKSLSLLAVDSAPQDTTPPPSYHIYSLKQHGNNTCFVPLSDSIMNGIEPDPPAIPPTFLGQAAVSTDSTFILRGTYREAALRFAGADETDSLFIYSLNQNKLLALAVSQVPIDAFLSPYGNESALSQSDYMFGFRLTGAFIERVIKNHEQCLVAIEKTNPFQIGGAVDIRWELIKSESFPTSVKIPERLAKFEPGDCFQFEVDGMDYYSRVYLGDERIYAMHVLVLKDEEVLYNQVYASSEGRGPITPRVSRPAEHVNWTGRLFKKMPSIMYGFYYLSFGCPDIRFVGDPELKIRIICDNRH